MSSIVKHKDKKTGIVYCYESVSYWDKDLKQPRSHRRLIGKLDPETGEIIPTGAKGRPKKEAASPAQDNTSAMEKRSDDITRIIAEKDRKIEELKEQNRRLSREKDEILKRMRDICALFSD